MGKRTFKEIRNRVLKELKNTDGCSFGYLEREVNTNWQTIRDHIENLRFFGVVEINEENRIRLGKKLILA